MNKYVQNKVQEVKFKLYGTAHNLMASSTSGRESENENDEDGKKRSRDKQREEQGAKLKKRSVTRLQCDSSKQLSVDAESNLPSESSVISFEDGILFRCPELGEEVMTQYEWKCKIREQLAKLKETDVILAAILTIKSLNPPRVAEQCISVLEKYMRNIIDYPDVDKFRLIRLGNQILNEKILSVEGGLDFLMSIGFKTALGGKDNKDPYLVYNPGKTMDLDSIVTSLRSVTAFELELDRNIVIIRPQDVSNREELTDEFYDWTLKDMQKEQKSREEEREKRSQFRRNSRKQGERNGSYSYTKIRVKFPDGVTVEAAFSVKEKLYSLKTLLLSKFYFYENFSFMALPSRVFNVLDEEKTFNELDLFPKVTLMIKWEMNTSGNKYAFKEAT